MAPPAIASASSHRPRVAPSAVGATVAAAAAPPGVDGSTVGADSVAGLGSRLGSTLGVGSIPPFGSVI